MITIIKLVMPIFNLAQQYVEHMVIISGLLMTLLRLKIRLVNNAFAYSFKETRLATTSGSDLEHNKYVGIISTNMRVLICKDGDLLPHFDGINETQAAINDTSLKHMLIGNHDEANRGKIKNSLNLEDIFDFVERLKK